MSKNNKKNYFIVSSNANNTTALVDLLRNSKFSVVTTSPAKGIVFWAEEDVKEMFEEYDQKCILQHGPSDYRAILKEVEENLLSEQISAGDEYLHEFVENYVSSKVAAALENDEIDLADDGRILYLN